MALSDVLQSEHITIQQEERISQLLAKHAVVAILLLSLYS